MFTTYSCEQGYIPLMLKLKQKKNKKNAIKDVDTLMRALETRLLLCVSKLADEIQQQRLHRMDVEMTQWYENFP